MRVFLRFRQMKLGQVPTAQHFTHGLFDVSGCEGYREMSEIGVVKGKGYEGEGIEAFAVKSIEVFICEGFCKLKFPLPPTATEDNRIAGLDPPKRAFFPGEYEGRKQVIRVPFSIEGFDLPCHTAGAFYARFGLSLMHREFLLSTVIFLAQGAR